MQSFISDIDRGVCAEHMPPVCIECVKIAASVIMCACSGQSNGYIRVTPPAFRQLELGFEHPGFRHIISPAVCYHGCSIHFRESAVSFDYTADAEVSGVIEADFVVICIICGSECYQVDIVAAIFVFSIVILSAVAAFEILYSQTKRTVLIQRVFVVRLGYKSAV